MMNIKHNTMNNGLLRRPSFLEYCASRNALCPMLLLLAVLALGGGCKARTVAPPNEPNESKEPNVPADVPPDVPSDVVPVETSLFDGKTLGQWKITDFGGQGDVYVKDGSIVLEMGNDMTGVTWGGPLIRMNYEITLEAMRVSGSDFFCGLTFPVSDKPCSLILGGWGGEVCGLSNIDYYDAANNETTRIVSFKNGQWYRVRLRVTPGKIEAWVDDEKIVDVETTGRDIDIRPEVDLSKPLGIATWQTAAAIRNIHMRALTEP